MMLVPVPGIGAGVLEPGQDLASYIDRAVFGENHLDPWTRTWDAEGLLATGPSIVNVLTECSQESGWSANIRNAADWAP